jgi:hypothetical protein
MRQCELRRIEIGERTRVKPAAHWHPHPDPEEQTAWALAGQAGCKEHYRQYPRRWET